MQIKDLQFPTYFLTREVNLDPRLIQKLLKIEVKISSTGEPDTAVFKQDRLMIMQPSSIAKFLFVALYTILKEHNGPTQQDRIGVGLAHLIKDYVYSDYKQIEQSYPSPVLICYEKLKLPFLLLRDIIGPLVGNLPKLPSVFITRCNTIDAAETIHSAEKFYKKHNISLRTISDFDYPLIAVNMDIYNEAAKAAHLVKSTLILLYGEQSTQKIIKNILLDEEDAIFQNVVSLAKTLEGQPGFVVDFLKFLESNVILSNDEQGRLDNLYEQHVANDKYLGGTVKVAQKPGFYSPQVYKQWHQWSMLQGLIEKQLGPARGSMWPTTEKMKPFDDKRKRLVLERKKRKNKKNLNYEELLELARELYNHKAIQPGKLYEDLLKDNRVWKN